jgi:hypothetical protein
MNYVEPGYLRSGYVELDSDTVRGLTFDPAGKRVMIPESLASLDAAEIYRAWIDWATTSNAHDDNAKWLPAVRYSGNDPIPGGYTGATFFMINGWRICYDPNFTGVTGVIFSEDYATAYWSKTLRPVYPITVSAVVNQVTTTQNVVTGDLGDVPDAVWEHIKALTVGKFLGLK